MNERLKELISQAFFDVFKEPLDWADSDVSQSEWVERFAELVRDDERKGCAEHYLGIMRDAVAREREACADLVFKMCNLPEHKNVWIPLHDAQLAIRARGEPSPAFKNFIDDKWSGIV